MAAFSRYVLALAPKFCTNNARVNVDKIDYRMRLSSINPSKYVILLKRSEEKIVNCQFSSSSYQYSSDVIKKRKVDWPSKLNFGNDHHRMKSDFLDVFSVSSDEEISPEIVGSIPTSVLENAKPILEERKAKMEKV